MTTMAMVSPLFSRRRRTRKRLGARRGARRHDAPIQTFRIPSLHDTAREQRLKETLLLHAEPRAVSRLRRSRLCRRGRRWTRRVDRLARGGTRFRRLRGRHGVARAMDDPEESRDLWETVLHFFQKSTWRDASSREHRDERETIIVRWNTDECLIYNNARSLRLRWRWKRCA